MHINNNSFPRISPHTTHSPRPAPVRILLKECDSASRWGCEHAHNKQQPVAAGTHHCQGISLGFQVPAIALRRRTGSEFIPRRKFTWRFLNLTVTQAGSNALVKVVLIQLFQALGLCLSGGCCLAYYPRYASRGSGASARAGRHCCSAFYRPL
eukprot:422642-Pelagomonas_calceolata.AAC.3